MSDDVVEEGPDDPEGEAFLREVARIDDLPAPDAELRAGDRLAHFVIGARLGAGSMGAVYEALDDKLGRTVAIKVMRRTGDEARRRFLHEARAAAAVTHPNLVTVHEVGEVNGRAFIVMERIRGRTLRGLRTDATEALRIARAIAAGLAAAHEAGIVHRDLKPDNVMITADGAIKLLDFGIARFSSDLREPARGSLPMTGTGVVVGTPSYMSPEQASAREVDARSDVYSFGVVIAELLTGSRPAVGGPSPVVGPLGPVLATCLAPRPADRYADGHALSDALASVTLRPGRRRAAYGIATVVLLATGIAGWQLTHRSQRDRAMALVAEDNVRSSSSEAIAAYRGAFQSLRDAQFFDAVRGWEQAAQLDPTFAAAHLRLALAKRWFHSPEEGRRSFEVAVKHRELLDTRDRILLDAAEPGVMRQPYDYAESARRFEAALVRNPYDSELMYWLGYAYSELGEQEKLVELTDRMAAIDPAAAVAWSSRALTLFYLGDLRGAREAAIECRRVAPTQGACAFELEKILDTTGACSELETVLRAWMIASPEEPRAPRELARLLLATGRPLPAAQEMFAQARARRPEAERSAAKTDDDGLVRWSIGDFTQPLAEDSAVDEVLDQIDIAFETGQPDVARAAAETYLAKAAAFPSEHGTSDANLFADPLGVVLATLDRTGAMPHAEAVKRRDTWARDLEASIAGLYRRQIWAAAYANPAMTPQQAAEALAVLPNAPLPQTYWFPHIYGRIGRAFVLGGRPGDGVPYLERATHRCLERDPRDFLYLGLAHEALGHEAEACAAFAAVIARWGDAKPRSVTAEHARERLAALGCDTRR